VNVNDIISSGLLEQYVLGNTTEQQSQQVQAWQIAHPEVAAELLAIEDALMQLDFANAKPVSANVKQNILATINANTQSTTTQTTTTPTAKIVGFNYWKLATAAALALFVGSTIYFYTAQQKLSNQLATTKATINAQQQTIANLNQGIESVADNSSQQIVLKGTPTTPNSTAKIFWVRNTGNVYVEASGLPQAPSGMQYQLWAIVDGKPVNAGMIALDNNGKKYNIQKMASFGNAQAFAITLEKAGGSPTPTMEKMVVITKL
jgi:anti-sigma-K factor RskA